MIIIKKSWLLFIISLLLLSITIVSAEENATESGFSITTFAVLENNNTAQNTSSSNETAKQNQSMQLNETNINETNTTSISTNNVSTNNSSSQTDKNISLLKIFPDYIKLGDAQINLQIENNGATELKNVEAQVTGAGFSTYEVNEIESLKSKEKGYILIMGSFKKTGNISLKIKIKDFIFYSNITVYDPFYVAIDIEKETKLEQDKKKKLDEFAAKIDSLQKQYQQLEKQLDEKKNDEYDISGVNLQDLKTYIRNTQASLAVADEKDSQGNYVLAENEYNYQKEKIANLHKIERSLKQAIVDNAILISTIVGGLVAMITLVEIARRQKERVSEKIKNIQLKKENVQQAVNEDKEKQ